MGKSTRAAAAFAAMAAFFGTAIVSPVSAAAFDNRQLDCRIPNQQWSCTTDKIQANPNHWIKRWIYAPPDNQRITQCWVHDADNGIVVDTDRVPSNQPRSYRQIPGLYGWYFITCIRYNAQGLGAPGPKYTAGRIQNY